MSYDQEIISQEVLPQEIISPKPTRDKVGANCDVINGVPERFPITFRK